MRNVTFRFHGRFLYAKHLGDPKPRMLSVIAPAFDPPDVHQPLMSIRHSDIQFQRNGQIVTTAAPAFRIVTDAPDDAAQIVVWDLRGKRVRYVVTANEDGDVTPFSAEVASVNELEGNQGRNNAQLRGGVDVPGSNLCNAVIEVLARGTAMSKHGLVYDFCVEAEKQLPNPHAVKDHLNPANDLERKPAELVDFNIALDAVPGEVARLTLEIIDTNGVMAFVTVLDGGTVGFSNNCPAIHEPPKVDAEFARYYDFATTTDHLDALIPFDPERRLIEGIPCYQQAIITTP